MPQREDLVDLAATALSIVQLVEEKVSHKPPYSQQEVDDILQSDGRFTEFSSWLCGHHSRINTQLSTQRLAELVGDWQWEHTRPSASRQKLSTTSPRTTIHCPSAPRSAPRSRRPASARGDAITPAQLLTRYCQFLLVAPARAAGNPV